MRTHMITYDHTHMYSGHMCTRTCACGWDASHTPPPIGQAAVKHPPSDLAAVPGDGAGPLLLVLLALAAAGAMAWRWKWKPVVKDDAYMAL